MKLYIVPTPIGNLEDITLRAIRILKEVDTILAEDTRTSGVLLKHYYITTPMHSYHMHNEHKIVENVVQQILSGKNIALISDAGTPGISDPAYLLVRECIANNIEVECLPGATAFAPALVASGLPTNSFIFYGFPPLKKGRQTLFTYLSQQKETIILYESPHRLARTLKELCTYFQPERTASVCRELSKKFEEYKRGSLQELCDFYTLHQVKGEIVLVIGGLEKPEKVSNSK